MKKVKFDIQGMTCTSCSLHVEKAVSKLKGIENVNVNLLSNNMIVEYNDNILNNDEIINAVIEAGYGAKVSGDKEKKNVQKKLDTDSSLKSMKNRLIVSICFLIPLMYIAMNHMLYDWFRLPIPQFIKENFHGIQNAITFAVTQVLLLIPIIYLNRNYFIIGFKRLFKGTPNMDSLVAIGSSSAILYGIFAIYMIGYGLGHNRLDIVQTYSMNIYFESAGTILTLITLGKYLEAKSKGKTSDAISKLINLTPKTAVILRETEIEIPVEEILVGDIIIIKPGAGIPVDGIIIEGSSSIDEASITGESIPVSKTVGDNIISGTVNRSGYLKMKATKVGKDTTLSQIIKLVEEASNSKAPISKLADKVSGVFVPTVIIIAIIATIFWILQGQTFEFALSIGIAVLVISCPCALGLATPVAIMVGTGKGAEKGILIKSAESLELLHSVDTVVLDKTGTITEGKPKITDIISKIPEDEFIKIAGSLEKKSEHPLAEAILKKVNETYEIENFKSIPGRGVQGIANGITYFGGNLAFMQENNIDIKDFEKQCNMLLKQGKTVLYFAKEQDVIGIIAVADTVKKDSYQAIKELKKKNIEVVMLTEAIGNELKIDKVISEVLPQDKEKEISNLKKQGKRVAFVGDGINDSPALVRADIGLAIGSGTDIAIESADIVLIKNSLLDAVTAINLSKAVIRNIKINLFWAFFYNTIGIPLAAGVFYLSFGLKLSPMIGAAAMSLSSVCVVTNALRLKKFKSNYKREENNMNTKTIYIEGMSCNHCKMSAEKALNSIDGIIKAEVNLEKKNAIIEYETNIDNKTIEKVIEEAGFIVKEIK